MLRTIGTYHIVITKLYLYVEQCRVPKFVLKKNESRLSYKDLDPEAIQLINYFAKADFEEFGYQMVESKFQEDYSLEALA